MEKKRTRLRRFSTKQRILISYICICLVPIILLAGAFAVSSFRARAREEDTRRLHISDSAASTVDYEFYRLRNLSQQLSSTTWVKKRMVSSPIFQEDFSLSQRISICSDLRGYTATSGILSRLSLVFPEKDEVYSSTGLYTTEDFFHSFSLERDQEPLSPETVYENVDDYLSGSLISGADLGMTGGSAQKLFYLSGLEQQTSQLRCFLLAELNPERIQYMVSAIVTSDLAEFSINTADTALVHLSLRPGESLVRYEFQSRYFPVTMVSGFHAAPAVHSQDMAPLAILVLVCLSFSFNLAVFLTKLTYRPIQELVIRMEGKRSRDKEQMDDFEAIAQAVTQLHTAHENVLRMAEQYRENARETCLRKLLQGDYTAVQAGEKCREFDIPFPDTMAYTVLLVEGSGLALPLEEALSKAELPYELVSLSKTRTAVIWAEERQDRSNPDRLVRQVIAACGESSDADPTYGCGSPMPGIVGIAHSYYDALAQLESKLSDRIRGAASKQSWYFPTEWSMELINHVRFGQEELAEALLCRLRQENDESDPNTKQLITVLAQTYGRIIQELAADPSSYGPQFDAIASERTLAGMWQQLLSLNHMFCTERAGANRETTLELQLVNYVKEHLTDPDISLKELSGRFNLSVSAISKLFKRSCGINFYDFLLSRRMNTACEILKTQDIALSAVARAVGYENEYSFKRAFSRFYGISVSEYLQKAGSEMNQDK